MRHPKKATLAILALLLSVHAGLALPAPPDSVVAAPFTPGGGPGPGPLHPLDLECGGGSGRIPDLPGDSGHYGHSMNRETW